MSLGRILVVDDEWQIQEVIRLSLEDYGFEYDGVTQASELQSAVQESRPDLILLGHNLPETSAAEVCRELKGHPATAEIPILLIVDAGTFSDLAESSPFSSGGPDGFLQKPFRPVGLLEAINRALHRGPQMGGSSC